MNIGWRNIHKRIQSAIWPQSESIKVDPSFVKVYNGIVRSRIIVGHEIVILRGSETRSFRFLLIIHVCTYAHVISQPFTQCFRALAKR